MNNLLKHQKGDIERNKKKNKENFEYIWKGDAKVLLRKLHGVDMRVTKKQS